MPIAICMVFGKYKNDVAHNKEIDGCAIRLYAGVFHSEILYYALDLHQIWYGVLVSPGFGANFFCCAEVRYERGKTI